MMKNIDKNAEGQVNVSLSKDRRCYDCEFFEFDFMKGNGFVCMNKQGERYGEKINRGECCNDWIEF